MKRVILFVLFALAVFSSQAKESEDTKSKNEKKERTIDLWGHIKDSFTKVGILGTKITLMRSDSSVVDTMTVKYFDWGLKLDTYYKFNIPARPQKFIIRAEHPDYKPTYVDYDIKYVARNVYFDAPWHYMKKRAYRMTKEQHVLNELVVKATKIKIAYKGDTVVYNADAFNLSKGSMLDDLVKQMPGVELKDNGEIYQNGKKVDYLMLNGKQFFKGKNKVMLENLPYYTVKNVQFYNRTTDKSAYLGHDVEKKEFVMDVNLKPEYSTGYTVNAEVAGGTKDRYLSRLFGLRYTDNTRISLYGSMNNVNEYRSPGRDGDWTPTNSPEGIIDTKNAGVDVVIEDKDQRFSEYFSGSAGWYDGTFSSRTSSESFLTNGNSYSRSENDSQQKNLGGWISNVFILKKPLFVRINNNIEYFKYDQNAQNRSATFNANPEKYGNLSQILDSVFSSSLSPNLNSIALNRQSIQMKGTGHDTYWYNSIVASKKLSWGDDIEVSSLFNYRNTMNSVFNSSQLSYLQNNTSDNRNKYNTTPSEGYDFNIRGDYTFHLLSKWSYVLYSLYTKRYSSDVNSLYRLDWLNGWGSGTRHSLGELPSTRDSLLLALDAANSYNKRFTEQGYKEGFSVYYEKKEKDSYTWFNLHLPIDRQNKEMRYQRNQLDTMVYRRDWVFEPEMTFTLKTNKMNREYSFNYRSETIIPDLVKLVNIRDDANPLAVLLGNPNLKSTIKHNFKLNFSDRKPERQRFFNFGFNASIIKRQIANGFTYNPETGVYTYRPENVDGNWNMNTSVGYGSAIDKDKHWSWGTETAWNFNRNVDLTAVSRSTQSSLSKVNNHSVSEGLQLNYQKDDLKLGVIGKLWWNNATSRRENFQTINARDYSYGMTGEYKLFKEIELATDIKMYSRRGYGDSFMNTNNLVWNASIGHAFLKGKVMTRLEGFDLLHQLSSVQYVVNGQGKTETWRNTIPSYVMLHLSYRFSYNPKKK
ncbi:outer membrane beta-barrel protein [Parabacteroides sp. FAFU027]|uniref:outer membrane beta-barrel protein n=1 Tax=Parabacteroides sp. FAFU027 TaxID=2922715 RepID=UPI001FAFB1CF|nr:outer membrane beta-barrel protein [Parabacteroides sp. FAFU027]